MQIGQQLKRKYSSVSQNITYNVSTRILTFYIFVAIPLIEN